MLQRYGDNAEELYFLQDGVIEIFTQLDEELGGGEFILEKLFRGSVINYRTFFLEESGKVFYRFGRKSILYKMPFSKFDELLSKPRNKILKKKFDKYMNQAVMEEKLVPLDYKMNVPTHLEELSIKEKFPYAVDKQGNFDYSKVDEI